MYLFNLERASVDFLFTRHDNSSTNFHHATWNVNEVMLIFESLNPW